MFYRIKKVLWVSVLGMAVVTMGASTGARAEEKKNKDSALSRGARAAVSSVSAVGFGVLAWKGAARFEQDPMASSQMFSGVAGVMAAVGNVGCNLTDCSSPKDPVKQLLETGTFKSIAREHGRNTARAIALDMTAGLTPGQLATKYPAVFKNGVVAQSVSDNRSKSIAPASAKQEIKASASAAGSAKL